MPTVTSTVCTPTKQKPARLNPARRKAAKAKEAVLIQDSVNAVLKSAVNDRDAKSIARKPVSPPNRINRSEIPRRSSVQKTIAFNKQAQSEPVFCAASNVSKLRRPEGNPLSNPASTTGGLIGCVAGAAILLGAGIVNRVVGIDSAIHTARTSKAVVNNLIEDTVTSLKSGTYNPPEALDMLRRTSLAYAGALPGGTAFVEHLFHEIDVVRRQRGGELDRALAEASFEIAKARKRKASAADMQAMVLKQLAMLSAFTGNATKDIMSRNPGLRPYLPAAHSQKIPTVKLNMTVRQKSAAAS